MRSAHPPHERLKTQDAPVTRHCAQWKSSSSESGAGSRMSVSGLKAETGVSGTRVMSMLLLRAWFALCGFGVRAQWFYVSASAFT